MTVAMTGVLAVVIIVGVAVGAIGALYAARTRADNAADAAALAAAVATYPAASGQMPVSSAREIAAANGATLTECDCAVDTSLTSRVVLVSVVVDAHVPVFGPVRVRSSSRAEFDPGRWLGR
ncbi:MAG: pilus assembly protein TadG-related protein [Acidimicrobiia bacterium]|jgi:secretion/DNA translocation related TadE-like protein